MASLRLRWAGNLAIGVLVVGGGFAVNRIAGSVTAIAGWFAVAVILQVLGNIVVARQARAAAAGAADPPVPPAEAVPDWVVDRGQVAQAVAAVTARRGRGRTVGITTALHGAGGFGKTTVAKKVGADQRVRKHFRGRVYTVTIGRDALSRAQIAAIVAEQTRFITGDTNVFDDPIQAGRHLGRLLNQCPRTLLVIDDVWKPEQLEPFLLGAPGCVRLVTTRVPEVLPPGSERIPVDQMSAEQARRVLTWQLILPESVVADLIEVTGRWPLLVRLANRTIEAMASTGADATREATTLLERLRQGGPAAVNRPGLPVDLDDPVRRNMLVHASVQAAVRLLPGARGTRFTELGVFAEDEAVPVSTVAWLWQATGGLGEDETRDTCGELAGLSLLTLDPADGGRVTLHDVIRDYLRAQLGTDGLEHVNQLLVEQVTRQLPAAGPLAGTGTGPGQAWWGLDGYMLDHAIEHLLDAGWADRAEKVATDLRWVQARLHQRGPLAPWSDLLRIATPAAAERARELLQIAHLLAPTDPPHALDAILHSRLEHLPAWGAQIAVLRQGQPDLPRLVNDWHLPDLPDQMLRHVLAGHADQVSAVAISPDGTWLATAGDDSTVRIWDRATGKNTANLTGHTGLVTSVAISPDGTWLAATGGYKDAVVRIWDLATGKNTATLTGHTFSVHAVAISPDGTWLATTGWGPVRIWDRATSKNTANLTGHTGQVSAVAISPDATWLATAGFKDETVRIWDRATSKSTATLTGHTGRVSAVAISPDATWLATAGDDKIVRIWDRATGKNTANLTGHTGRVSAVAISPDATWLATAGDDKIVRIWDRATSENTANLTGHSSDISALAISPDGTWLASADDDGVVRIWDLAISTNTATSPTGDTGHAYAVISPDGTWLASADGGVVRIWNLVSRENTATLQGHIGYVGAVAISPDGTWLASADGGVVRIWNLVSGENTATLKGHTGSVEAVAISPDGTWLASADAGGLVRIWDRATGENTATLKGHTGSVEAVAISPDRTWLASAGWDSVVRIWDRATGENTATLKGHTGSVEAVAISPDRTWLASADDDGVVRIWDRGTGKNTATWTGHTGSVHAVAISPDGTWLATTGADQTVRVWGVNILFRPVTTMRVDGSLGPCAWTADGRSLAVSGGRGPYLFRFRPGT